MPMSLTSKDQTEACLHIMAAIYTTIVFAGYARVCHVQDTMSGSQGIVLHDLQQQIALLFKKA